MSSLNSVFDERTKNAFVIALDEHQEKKERRHKNAAMDAAVDLSFFYFLFGIKEGLRELLQEFINYCHECDRKEAFRKRTKDLVTEGIEIHKAMFSPADIERRRRETEAFMQANQRKVYAQPLHWRTGASKPIQAPTLPHEERVADNDYWSSFDQQHT